VIQVPDQPATTHENRPKTLPKRESGHWQIKIRGTNSDRTAVVDERDRPGQHYSSASLDKPMTRLGARPVHTYLLPVKPTFAIPKKKP